MLAGELYIASWRQYKYSRYSFVEQSIAFTTWRMSDKNWRGSVLLRVCHAALESLVRGRQESIPRPFRKAAAIFYRRIRNYFNWLQMLINDLNICHRYIDPAR